MGSIMNKFIAYQQLKDSPKEKDLLAFLKPPLSKENTGTGANDKRPFSHTSSSAAAVDDNASSGAFIKKERGIDYFERESSKYQIPHSFSPRDLHALDAERQQQNLQMQGFLLEKQRQDQGRQEAQRRDMLAEATVQAEAQLSYIRQQTPSDQQSQHITSLVSALSSNNPDVNTASLSSMLVPISHLAGNLSELQQGAPDFMPNAPNNQFVQPVQPRRSDPILESLHQVKMQYLFNRSENELTRRF
jgi:hypothetical protein